MVDREGVDGAGPRNRSRRDVLSATAGAEHLRRMDRDRAIVAERNHQLAAFAAGPEGGIFGGQFGEWSHGPSVSFFDFAVGRAKQTSVASRLTAMMATTVVW